MEFSSSDDEQTPPQSIIQSLSMNYASLGDFLLFRDCLLGTGSFGEVYLGVRKNQLKRLYAIKVLLKKRCNRISLEREVKILSKISHTNIVKFYKIYDNKTHIYIIFEYCEGGSLASLIKERLKNNGGKVVTPCLKELEALQILKQIVASMIFCLQSGIMHRDLKPDNVLFRKGVVKVCDFGLARFFQGDSKKREKFTEKKGSPLYMAPERLTGMSYSPQSEVWSLGVMLYECLVGRVPWIGWEHWEVDSQLIEYIDHWNILLDKGLEDLAVSSATKALLRSMLAKEQERRADFNEISKILEENLDFLKYFNENQGNSKEMMQIDLAKFQAANQKALETGEIDNCYLSFSMSIEKKDKEREELMIIELPALDESISTPLKIPRAEKEATFLSKTLDEKNIYKKAEEFFSIRINLGLFLRKLVDSLLFYSEKLVSFLPLEIKDLVETIGAIKLLEISLLLELKDFIASNRTIKGLISEDFYDCKAFKNHYLPLTQNNYALSIESFNVFLDETKTKGIPMDPHFSEEITLESKLFEFINKKTLLFVDKYAKKWLEMAVKNDDLNGLVILKMLVIGRNLQTLEKLKFGEGYSYLNGLYDLYAEMKSPDAELLIDFLDNEINPKLI